jgi:predicted nucleic acid-binding protein
MPKPRVYVETTIPNFYYDFRNSPAVVERREITRRWWADAEHLYELVTSSVVRDELARGTSDRVPLRLDLLQPLQSIPFVPNVAEIVQSYIRHKLMPANPPEDALHLALASWHHCDFIVTWNCRHLANPNKAGHIRRINTRLGLWVPRLVTPAELLEEQDERRMDGS